MFFNSAGAKQVTSLNRVRCILHYSLGNSAIRGKFVQAARQVCKCVIFALQCRTRTWGPAVRRRAPSSQHPKNKARAQVGTPLGTPPADFLATNWGTPCNHYMLVNFHGNPPYSPPPPEVLRGWGYLRCSDAPGLGALQSAILRGIACRAS